MLWKKFSKYENIARKDRFAMLATKFRQTDFV